MESLSFPGRLRDRDHAEAPLDATLTFEAEALTIWQNHGFNVVPVDADLLIPNSGAFHCVAKTIDAAP